MPKTRALLLDSDFSGREVSCNVRDGSIVVDNKEFFIDDIKGINIKKKFGAKDLYLLKWKSIRPAKFIRQTKKIKGSDLKREIKNDNNYLKVIDSEDGDYKEVVITGKEIKEEIIDTENYEIRELVPVKLEFDEKTKQLPSIMQSTVDMRFLALMKKYAEGKAGMKIGKGFIIVVAFALSFVVAFLLSLNYYGMI